MQQQEPRSLRRRRLTAQFEMQTSDSPLLLKKQEILQNVHQIEVIVVWLSRCVTAA